MVKRLIGSNMRQIAFLFLLSLMICSCGGSSSNNASSSGSANGNGQSLNQNKLPYPGFYGLSPNERKEKADKEPYDFYDGYFDRHPSNIKMNGELKMDVIVPEVLEAFGSGMESSSSSESDARYSVAVERGTNIEADCDTSELFLYSGKKNYVIVTLSWDVDEKPEYLDQHRYYLCNPKKPDEVLFDMEYYISDNEWKNGNGYVHIPLPIERPGKYGLCRRYKDYAPVIYDVLEVKEYLGADYDVSLVNVGSEQKLKIADIEGNKDYFYRAGVNINYRDDYGNAYNYDVPRSFEDERIKGFKYLNNRGDFLFVRGEFKDEYATHKCYENVKDDITLVNQKIKHDVQNDLLNKRVAIIYNKTHVRFWTFYEDDNGYVRPCWNEMKADGQPKADVEYKVIMLNMDKSECDWWYPEGGDVDYTRLYIKNSKGVWSASDGFHEYGVSEFNRIFDPECHVFIDIDRYNSIGGTEGKPYLKSVIPGTALGLTDEILVDFEGRPIGLWAFINPSTDIRTYMHELGHLLGLADVKSENNLMYWNNPKKEGEKEKTDDEKYKLLNNQPLTAKECATCGWQDNVEFQWDCLNNINVSTSCLLSSHRKLDWR